MTEIARLLSAPECRLLSLIGPGGIGKTRLAVEAARQFRGCDGVHFVPLQQVTSPGALVGAIADAAGLRTGMTDNPQQELLEQLRNKSWLLVLDNFEQLLGSATLLSAMLAEAAGLRLLVTSRVRLNLLEEFVLEVGGLACPFSEHDMNTERNGAVELFVERARRANTSFVLTEAQHRAVFRIVHLVDGMPLGIELAAHWIRALSCDAIADEIERSLDILATSGRNFEPRHRTMRAAFESTWKQLAPDEQQVFMRLSLFRGGFTREAAAHVAGASLPALSALIDQSLLRIDERGRYEVHELLRQYGQEWLEQDKSAADRAHDDHSAYFCGYLADRERAIVAAGQQAALRAIALELDNIRAAWAWAVERLHSAQLKSAASALSLFCDFQGRYHEGVELCEQAIERLLTADSSREHDAVMAVLFSEVGWLYIRLGRYEKALHAFHGSLAIYSDLQITPPPGYTTEPTAGLALLATVLGDFAEAVELAEAVRAAAVERGENCILLVAHYVLASVAYAQGEYETARKDARQAYTLANEAGSQWMAAYALIVLGNVARAIGDFHEAYKCYQTCYGIQQQLGNPEGMAVAQLSLAGLARLQDDYEEAERLFQASYAMCCEINDPGGQVRSLAGLGDTLHAMGHEEQAATHFRQALELAIHIRSIPLLLLQFTPIGELLVAAGELELGMLALTSVTRHPAAERMMQNRAQISITRIVAARPDLLRPEEAAKQQQDDPFLVAAQLQECLATELRWRSSPAAQQARPASVAQPGLVEALSERELEILRLLAEGLTNRQIADALTLVVGTVKAHNHHIFGKLGVSNRVQALTRARELNLI